MSEVKNDTVIKQKEPTIVDYLRDVVEREYDAGQLCVNYNADGSIANCFWPNDRNYNMQRIMELLLSRRCTYLPADLSAKLVAHYEHEQRMNNNPKYIPTENDYQITGWLHQVRETVAKLCFHKEREYNEKRAEIINKH